MRWREDEDGSDKEGKASSGLLESGMVNAAQGRDMLKLAYTKYHRQSAQIISLTRNCQAIDNIISY